MRQRLNVIGCPARSIVFFQHISGGHDCETHSAAAVTVALVPHYFTWPEHEFIRLCVQHLLGVRHWNRWRWFRDRCLCQRSCRCRRLHCLWWRGRCTRLTWSSRDLDCYPCSWHTRGRCGRCVLRRQLRLDDWFLFLLLDAKLLLLYSFDFKKSFLGLVRRTELALAIL